MRIKILQHPIPELIGEECQVLKQYPDGDVAAITTHGIQPIEKIEYEIIVQIFYHRDIGDENDYEQYNHNSMQ